MTKWEMRNPRDPAWYLISLLCYLDQFINNFKERK
jgi:hypothetical protein